MSDRGSINRDAVRGRVRIRGVNAMKKIVLSALAAVTTLGVTSAQAADMPVKAKPLAPVAESPWDWAFGGQLLTDYNFRGISQSNRGASGTVYSETRYNVNK